MYSTVLEYRIYDTKPNTTIPPHIHPLPFLPFLLLLLPERRKKRRRKEEK